MKIKFFRDTKKISYKLSAALFFLITIIGTGGCASDITGTETINANSDNHLLENTTEQSIAQLPDFTGTKVSESELYIEKIDNIDNDFIRGADISSYLSLIESGVTFKDWEGNTLDDKGFFTLLGESGINWIRIRIWNDPYDSKGNPYGGGNNDVDTAIKIGELATSAGMQVLIDYHYSDFWADPGKQKAPKEWAHYTYDDKKTAFGEFTKDSLSRILDAGVNVGMVQIGNETVSGICGETKWEQICELMNVGCAAVRSVSSEWEKDIMIAIHFTNPESKQFLDYAAVLEEYAVDYDVFASSYYSFWHGTPENLTDKLSTIASSYGKKVLVAETSYAYTDEDGDGWSNSVHSSDNTLSVNYDISQQGQVNALSDVIKAAADVGDNSLGIFYWEPAWIPVQVYDAGASNASEVLSSNQEKWETLGSGWASSYAKTYDPDDAGKYYGGSSWDNQALFDFYGNPLESLNIFKYIYSGTTAKLQVETVKDITYQSGVGEELIMPETVPATLTNGKTKDVPVIWDDKLVEDAIAQGGGTYEITGTATADGAEYELTCVLEILRINFISNPGLEDKDMTMWKITGEGADRESDNNKRSGDYSLKFWSTEPVSYTAEQEITDLDAGIYELGAFLQGGDAGNNALFQLYVEVNGTRHTVDTSVSGWLKWSEPLITGIDVPENTVVTVGVKVEAAAKAWGAWDDFFLYKMD